MFHLITDSAIDGGLFACGDLASGDIDNDGDIDVLGPVARGEWVTDRDPHKMYWYENPGWEVHEIGIFPSFIKDLDLVDFNNDGKLDLAATCFFSQKMVVFRQDDPDSWTKVAEVFVQNLHEGQHVGDIDGDGYTDVVSTGFWFKNPGGDLSGKWQFTNFDPFWNSDNGKSWKYNATKIVCADIDQDNRDEVFISCSEAFRDTVAWRL